jgi:hypothetical protein
MIVNTIDSWLPGVKLFRGSLLKNLKDDLFFCYNQTGKCLSDFCGWGPSSDCLLCELLLSYSNHGNFSVLIVFITNMLASFGRIIEY